jgi:hypothetical protein
MYSRKEEAILSSYTSTIEPAAAICIIQFFEEAAKYMIERSAISKALTLYAPSITLVLFCFSFYKSKKGGNLLVHMV